MDEIKSLLHSGFEFDRFEIVRKDKKTQNIIFVMKKGKEEIHIIIEKENSKEVFEFLNIDYAEL